MARPSSSKPSAKPVAKPVAEIAVKAPDAKSLPPVRAMFTPDQSGGGTVKLEYAGALAECDAIWVHFGESRGGRNWLNTREVQLERASAVASATIVLGPGEPIEGVCMAFHARRSDQELWDNAGRNFGCYFLDARTGTISTR